VGRVGWIVRWEKLERVGRRNGCQQGETKERDSGDGG